MSASTGTLWRILREKNPVAVIYYPERQTRAALIEEVRLLAPPEMDIIHTADMDGAFRDPEKIVLLMPDDEEAAVATLDRRREELRDRTAPVILFLLSDGSGEQRLKNAFALASWLRGREYDPERPQSEDVQPSSDDFQQRTGRSPEKWLAEWRADQLPDTLENNLLSHEALSLEERP